MDESRETGQSIQQSDGARGQNESLGPAEEGSSLFPQALGFDFEPQLVKLSKRNQ